MFRWKTVLTLSFLWFALSACSAITPQATTTPTPTKVTVQHTWVLNTELAGMFLAQDMGFYRDEGLEVEILPLGDTPARDLLSRGEADFMIATSPTLLLARSEGYPLTAVATMYQRSPLAFISLAENNITRPQDMVGKTVYLTQSSFPFVQTMLRNAGVDPAQVTLIAREEFSNDRLLNKEVDVTDAFINNQPIELEQAGYQLNVILPYEYGVPHYASLIITTDATIRERPELVLSFIRATIKGMKAAIEDPQGATQATLIRNPELNLVHEQEAMQRAIPLMNPANSRLGMMSPETWEFAYQLFTQDLPEPSFKASEVYNLSFLEQIYGE